ncbi:MAG: Rossmann-like and DUF2520 domain-containing protein [Candidatus Aminicenantales bacterium]
MVRKAYPEIKTVAIIGAGRVGTSLGLALEEKGFLIRAISCRRQDSAFQSQTILRKKKIIFRPEEAARKAEVIFLSVADDQLVPLVNRLAQSRVAWEGKFVFHLSGLKGSEILKPLEKRGAMTASFHPIQSFPLKGMPPSRWQNIFIGLEGNRSAVALAKRISLSLGAKPLLVNRRKKPLYHAACSLASNHLVALFSVAISLLRESGLQEREALAVLKPLLSGTCLNLASADPASALTGPVARADLETVKHHLEALGRYPRASIIYRQLGLEAVSLAKKRGLNSSKAAALKRLLQDK